MLFADKEIMFTHALNYMDATPAEADIYLSRWELNNDTSVIDWPRSLSQRQQGGRLDGWEGYYLLDSSELCYENGRWRHKLAA
jgi:hypothetical protein